MMEYWQWDRNRHKYYHYDVNRKQYIFADGEVVDEEEDPLMLPPFTSLASTSTIRREHEQATQPTANLLPELITSHTNPAHYHYTNSGHYHYNGNRKQYSSPTTSTSLASTSSPTTTATTSRALTGAEIVDPVKGGQLLVVQDHEMWYKPPRLFRSPPANLYYMNFMEGDISLLVCQHIIRNCEGTCPEEKLWSHEHFYETGWDSSVAVYIDRSAGTQSLVIDIGSIASRFPASHSQLKVSLIAATRNYRKYVLRTKKAELDLSAQNRNALHVTEMMHYRWMRISSQSFAGVRSEAISGDFLVSGVTCSFCQKWTRLGSRCCRCNNALHDEAKLDAESSREEVEGAVAGLAVAATAASFLFLNMLLMI